MKSELAWLLKAALALVFIGLASQAHSDEAKQLSQFERSLLLERNIQTKESIIEMNGKKFRRVEFEGQTYDLQLLEDEKPAPDLVVLCGEQGAARLNSQATPLVSGEIRVRRRLRMFVEGLKTHCDQAPGATMTRISYDPALAIGFYLDDDDDPKVVLKNRRLFINPNLANLLLLPMVGFAADW